MNEKLIEARSLIRDVQDVLTAAACKTDGEVRHNFVVAHGKLDTALILTGRLPDAAPGLTAAQLADALDYFGNDAITAMHNGTADVGCIAHGFTAVAMRLAEIGKEAPPTFTIREVLEPFAKDARADRPAEEPSEVERGADYRLINDTVLMGVARDEAIERAETAEASLAETRESLEKEREIERRHWQAKVDALNAECEATLLRAETAESTLSETRTALRQSQRALMSLPGPQSLEVADCIATNRAALTGDAQEGGR